MNKIEMQKLSATVAEHFLNKGYTEKTFKKLNKADLVGEFPQLIDLHEIPEGNYEKYIRLYPEESTLNYFKSLVVFDIVYKIRTEPQN